MNLITIDGLSKSYGNKKLFENLNLSIHENERIGLIGRNGEGKTSLLKIISGIEKEDDGIIIKNSELTIEYLPQNPIFSEKSTILEQVFKGESDNIRLVRNYKKEMSKLKPSGKKVLELTEEMDRKNVWELESEAKSILMKLGISDFNKKIGELSGGQKRRVALASALLAPVDLLVLDEPTNHLDNNTIEWLETYLMERSGSLLMVTHDRYFLERVVNRTFELDQKQIFVYEGNYNYYLKKKAEREEKALAFERKRKSIYKKELAWMNQGIRARGTRQKARLERFEELSRTSLDLNTKNIEISLVGDRLGKKIIEMKDISKSYGDKKIIDNFTYTFVRDDRIGILGDNGAGKSTLVNIISGYLEPDSGKVEIGETVKIGYFSQESRSMDLSLRAIDYIRQGGEFIETYEGSRITVSKMMESFLFSDKEQYSIIENLSGGEKRRLYLLRVLMEGPNLLILDEPTNDLDIETLNVLESYLDVFIGPVIIVSHDRYFLDKVVDKVLEVKDGHVKEYPGNYTFFKEAKDNYKEENQEKNKKQEKNEYKNGKRNRNRTLKFSYNEQREWNNIDAGIFDIESRIEYIDNEIIKNSSSYVKLEELVKEKEILEEELNGKIDRWIYLSELYEEIKSNK